MHQNWLMLSLRAAGLTLHIVVLQGASQAALRALGSPGLPHRPAGPQPPQWSTWEWLAAAASASTCSRSLLPRQLAVTQQVTHTEQLLGHLERQYHAMRGRNLSARQLSLLLSWLQHSSLV